MTTRGSGSQAAEHKGGDAPPSTPPPNLSDAERTDKPAKQAARGEARTQPTPGRIVTYNVRSNERGNNAEGSSAPAIITHVHDAELGVVNLRVFYNGPASVYLSSVERGNSPGQWNWPERT